MHRSLSGLPGTVLLVTGGAGCALLTAADPHVGVGISGVALAFGLTMMARVPAPRLSFRAMCSVVLALIPGCLAGGLVVYDLARGMLWFWWLMPVAGGIAGRRVSYYLSDNGRGRSG